MRVALDCSVRKSPFQVENPSFFHAVFKSLAQNASMGDSSHALRTAVRVITAIATDRALADPEDIAELESLAQDFKGHPPDELACEVIHRALKHRAELQAVVD